MQQYDDAVKAFKASTWNLRKYFTWWAKWPWYYWHA